MYSVDKIRTQRVGDAELARTLEAMTKHLS
jgi:hypothetical protein